MPRRLSAGVREQVRERANLLCEYCHTAERWQCVRFSIDHLTPTSEGGENSLENLALACFHCNRRKSDKLTAIDNETGQFVPLFNPRQSSWPEHFIWSGDGLRIIPLTAIGRATVDLLDLNRERLQYIRSADVSAGRHPPFDDPVQPIG